MYLEVSVKPYQAKQIIEQQVKKSRNSHIPWSQISKNKKYIQLISINNLYSTHEQHLKKLKQTFRKAVKEIQLTILDKNGLEVPRYYYDPEKDEYIRRNEFEDIKNEQTLLRFVQRSPKGVIVSQQLLEYTYKQVSKDIQKLLQAKKIKRIFSSNKTKKDYFIFANIIQQQYGLGQHYDHFGKDEYIEFCKKNYQILDDQGENNISGVGIGGGSGSSTSFNSWVPGYADLKEEWLLRNREKALNQAKAKS